jgi:hypothetical protein
VVHLKRKTKIVSFPVKAGAIINIYFYHVEMLERVITYYSVIVHQHYSILILIKN